MKVVEIRKSLKKIVLGDVLWEDEILQYYSVDASSYQIIPKVVVIPKNENDVVSVIKFVKKHNISVTVRGTGTGLVGSALNKDIILDVKNLNLIQIQKNYVKIGAGVTKGNLDKQLQIKKKFFPPNPSIGAFCSIGGMMGNNSSGSRSLKYGSVIDNIKEVTFVDGKGTIITLPNNKKVGKKIFQIAQKINQEKFPKVTKNSSGYRLDKIESLSDSHKIIIGSEGTLGIILSAKLEIKNIPKKRHLYVIEFQTLKNSVKSCLEILQTFPSAIEFVDEKTLKNIPHNFIKKTKCLLFVEYDSELAKKEHQIKKIIQGKIMKHFKKDSDIQKWWRYRDSALYYSLKSIKRKNRIPHVIEDSTVPIQNLEKLFLIIKKINEKFKTKSIMYGHAGNGNIHVRLVADRKKISILGQIAEEYFESVLKLGGTISGEHGDGLARTEFVKKQYGQKNYQLFKQLKNEFDPKNILNPGKIISKKSTIMHNLDNI